ncbi:hypothetical protein PsYK624_109780 [Phanerochaete sordida]|uniref:C2H2-type domain-containing protein n=1 Tax=Phanerochaete sordida TaxID=48140 RepID=A0A9P3GJR0_9APHY|nr:hypothetical protein PsYK624_109780 [Phanerochaete sordida]
MPFAHLPLQQQHYYRPSSFYGQHIQEPYPPGQAFQSCDPMQRFPPLGHAQQTRNPTNLRVLMHEEEARSGNSRTPPRVSEGQPGVARQEPGDAGSRSVPSARPDSHPAHPANFPVPHPLHLGPWSVPFSHPLRDPRAAVHDGWRPCSAAGNYPQLPPPAPSQAFRDFMADLGHPGQPPMPLPAPLPPVHAPPLHHFPPHVIGFSVPLRPRAGYRSALKERDWTTHFEALGRKGRKKRSHKKKKSENEDVEIKQPEKYQCPMCDRDFDRRNGLAIHMKWHYKETKDDSYLKGLGIAIPPLNFPHPMYFPPGAAYPPPILNGPMAVAPEMLASSASSGSEGSPELNSLPPSGSDISSARALSANTTLLSVSSLDTLPAPITPLATPPPSPGGSRLSSLVRLSAADVLNASGGPRARSESTRSMWDLFGSDD